MGSNPIFSTINYKGGIVVRKKIKIIDNISTNGKTTKVIEKEIMVRDEDHFKAQLTNKAKIFRNKKLYSRKIKHKNNFDN